ncbi:MAG: hypothetical protein II919_10025 [Lachnospiraceae bacterium]|nr:hypothetical protein [Lachnospiraceae bacterium]
MKKIIQNIGFDKLLIMAICGVALIILSIPTNQKSTAKKNELIKEQTVMATVRSDEQYLSRLEKRVEELLSEMDGISNVKVMITLKCTSESVVLNEISYEKNDRKTTNDGGTVSEENAYKSSEVVVCEKDANGNEIPYVIKERLPQIEGIAVVAKGGDNPNNSLKITNTLEALFGIEAHKISVIGMNQ